MKSTLPRFSKHTLDFIARAGRQKRADWLDRNQADYERFLQEPLQHLVKSLKSTLAGTATGYHFPQKGIGRLKRSANRAREYGAPFKDWIAYSASRPAQSRFERNPNLFFLLQPGDEDGDDVLVAGGLYMPSSRQLRAIREAIAVDASAFDRLFATSAFARSFPGGFSDERISSRPPRGFDRAHPRMDWLKLQAFFVWRSYKKKEFASAEFPALVARDWAQILRLNALLDAAIEGRLARSPERAPKTAHSLANRLGEIEAPRRQMDF